MTLKDELPRSVGTQNATGDQWRNNSRKSEGNLLVVRGVGSPAFKPYDLAAAYYAGNLAESV